MGVHQTDVWVILKDHEDWREGVTREDYGVRHHGGYLGRRARLDNV